MDAVVETLAQGLREALSNQGGNRILLLGARAHPNFANWKEVVGWQPFKPWADAWVDSGFRLIDELTQEKWPVVACLPGKSKEEILQQFGIAHDLVEPGGLVITALTNQTGAARFEKLWTTATGNCESISKRKCRAFWSFHDYAWDTARFVEWVALEYFRVN